jgi:hypothetical protein
MWAVDDCGYFSVSMSELSNPCLTNVGACSASVLLERIPHFKPNLVTEAAVAFRGTLSTRLSDFRFESPATYW